MERWLSWSKAHDWKSCIPYKGIKGSNPFLSAKNKTATIVAVLFFYTRCTGGLFPCCARGCVFAAPSSFSLCERKGFFLPCRQARFCAPHFFFLVRKKKRAAPGAKKKERAAALRCLGLLRIDRVLINGCVAIWKFFRMRFTISAAAAQWVQSILFCTLRCQRIDTRLLPPAATFGQSPQKE